MPDRGSSDAVRDDVLYSVVFDYESKVWLQVPDRFPTRDDQSADEWIDATIESANVDPRWQSEIMMGNLRELMRQQLEARTKESVGLLWFGPHGLPATGYVEIELRSGPDEPDFDLELWARGWSSIIEIFPKQVTAAHLGEGVGFSRAVHVGEGSPDAPPPAISEVVYAFLPRGLLLTVNCVSADPEMIGLMLPGVWDMLQTMKLEIV